MESKNLNNGILAEELVSVALLEDGFNVARPVRIGPLTSSQSGMERSSIGYYRDASKRRIMLARLARETSPALSKPYMTQQPVSGRSVGLQDPSKSRISYGRNVKR